MASLYSSVREIARSLWALKPHLRGGRWLVAAVTVTSLLAVLMESIGVGLLVPLLSLLLGGEGARPMRPILWMQEMLPGRSSAFYTIAFCAAIVLMIVAKNAVLYLSTLLAVRFQRRISCNLRNDLFERIHSADLTLFESHKAGELANTLFFETERTLKFIEALQHFSQRLAMGLFYFLALFLISSKLTVLAVLLALIIGRSMFFLHRRLLRSGQEITRTNQELSAVASESFGGVRVIRSTHSLDRVLAKFSTLLNEKGRAEESAARSHALLVPMAEVLAVAGAMFIVGWAYIFLVKPRLILPSHLLGFGFILLRLLPLLSQLYGAQGHLLFMADGVRRVRDWLEKPVHPRRPFGNLGLDCLKQEIRIENLTYCYPDGRKALDDVSIRIPAGSTVALVGPSGSGKSTLSSILLRFRTPTGGRILVDGVDFWEFSSESWHRNVGIVEQEAFLFNDTLFANIAFGFPAVDEASVKHAVEVTNLTDVIAAMPDGLQTLVGERGTMLSGGQRQRLAIARALVRNPRILILDEATSALDNISEREVQLALENATSGRTVIVIAHRLSTIRNADHIVVMDSGRVIEQGTWEELSAREGMFARLNR